MKKYLFLSLAFALLIGISAKAQSNFTSKLIGVGVVVSDIEKSIDFYVNGIGMVKTSSFGPAGDFAKRSGLTNGVTFAVTVLKLENSPEANEWKLLKIDGAKASHPQQKFIHDDVGPQYITINVKSLSVVLERLAKLNTLLLGSSPTPLNARSHFALVQDPDGNFIELIGPMEEVQK
jgi:catechol 2,3-dioxygenase-like lactoylglutathione lyase family enzyme